METTARTAKVRFNFRYFLIWTAVTWAVCLSAFAFPIMENEWIGAVLGPCFFAAFMFAHVVLTLSLIETVEARSVARAIPAILLAPLIFYIWWCYLNVQGNPRACVGKPKIMRFIDRARFR